MSERTAPPFPFIVGSGRCGSTLLWAMLNAHPDLALPPESPFTIASAPRRSARFDADAFLTTLDADRGFEKWGLPIGRVRREFEDRRPEDYPAAIRALYALYAREQGKPRYGDKTPGAASNVRLIKHLWPEARVIHLVRDGRDVATSYLDAPFGPTTVKGVAIRWRTRVRLADLDGRKLGPSSFTTVRYEALVAEPERELRRLASFLEIDFDERMLGYHRQPGAAATELAQAQAHANILRPPTVELRNWRSQMTPADVTTFERYAGPELDRFGYERRTSESLRQRALRVAVRSTRAQLLLRNGIERAHRDGVRMSLARAVRVLRTSRDEPRR